VFLHGLNVLGSGYGALGAAFAQQGWVVVLSNTARSSALTQIDDGIALHPALANANVEPNGFLRGALDMTRAAVSGHSMGASTTPSVLAADPGYRAGFSFAPGIAPAAGQVRVPFGIVHGTGDAVLDWQTFGLALYRNLTAVRDLRFFYVLDQDCSHGNVAGYVQLTQTDREVFARTSRVALGFLQCFVLGDAAGLEQAIGPAARAEARLHRLDAEVRSPQLWTIGTAAPGRVVRATLAAEAGQAGLFAAAAEASTPTPFGLLLLDPATLVVVAHGAAGADDLWSASLAIPDDPALVGARVPLQGLGADAAASLRLTGAWRLAIGPR
jgi:hypothetical protein